jgi:hypothetical protein
MNNECTNALLKWLWCARAARRWKKTATRVSKFDRLSLASFFDETTRRWEEKKSTSSSNT